MRETSSKSQPWQNFEKGHSPHIKSFVPSFFVPAHLEVLLAVGLKEPQLVHLWFILSKPRWSLGLFGVM